ncbi:MAG: hypothetical protein NC418_10275 [Muribaculaceae bacterium]|nr:hypothetical protein [Muribaculaceae bacterium]
MKIIAESSSTRTEWSIVDGTEVVEHAFTTGLNPYFQSRREISHSIRLELPEAFFKRRWEHLYFYGAGCANAEKCKIIESSLVAQFKTPVTVESDILGAARGLLVHEPGLACILGTGSNSCLYNGSEIVKTVAPLGFILGDEGSGAYMGKIMIADMLKGLAPSDLAHAFFEKFAVTPNVLLNDVYTNTLPSRTLSRYSTFLAENIKHEYCHRLVYTSFMRFFERNIRAYDYHERPISFVGSTSVLYEDILRKAAADFGATVKKITRNSMPGLILYHAD